MEARLTATARGAFRAYSGVCRHPFQPRGLATKHLPTRRVAGPAVHGDADMSYEELPIWKQIANKPREETEPIVPPKPSYASSPRLESPGVNEPLEPILLQKRRHSTGGDDREPLENVSCAAFDGGGRWPDDSDDEEDWRIQVRGQEEDYKEYFRDHKASPLSKIEVADTRKPITRATDGTADSYVENEGRVVLWRDEQLDTAEEALRRAVEIWKRTAMRGGPDSPHGRVFRVLRGENW